MEQKCVGNEYAFLVIDGINIDGWQTSARRTFISLCKGKVWLVTARKYLMLLDRDR